MIRFTLVLLILVLGAQRSWALGDAGARPRPETMQMSGEVNTQPSLPRQVVALLTARFAAMNAVTPQPLPDATDAKSIARRLEALQELSAFGKETVNGLIQAAPSDEMRAYLEERLTPALAAHQQRISANLEALLNHPLVGTDGWFIISRFGVKADHNGALLVGTTPLGATTKDRIFARLQQLAPLGETQDSAVRLVGDSIGHKSPNATSP